MSEIRLFNVDCMEFMRGVPDKHYELAIVDPPYGINVGSSGVLHNNSKYDRGFKSNKKYKPVGWDKSTPNKKYFEELLRVSKKSIIWGGNFFFDHLSSQRSFIVWYKKGKDTNPNFSPCEFAWTNCGGLPAVCFIDWIGFGYINSGETKIHPTQKPVALYKWLLKNYAKDGDKILDTHGGSMSIAIACHDMGFDLDLCELDPDYYAAGVKRFEQHKAQLSLF